MEGISHEAISLAGHLQAQQADRAVRRQHHLHRRRDLARRVRRPGQRASRPPAGRCRRIDGHDPASHRRAPSRAAQRSDKPTLIACKTMIGYGAPTKQGKASTHGEPLGAERSRARASKLGWPHAPVRGAGRRARGLARRRARGAARAQGLGAACRASSAPRSASCSRDHRSASAAATGAAIAEIKAEFAAGAAQDRHPRRTPQKVLEKLVPALPGADRRLGRPDRLQQHPHQAPHARRRPATSAATTSTTACASTAWPRP